MITISDIMKVADGLIEQEEEACKRSAVSRYFYACLHSSQHWLDSTPGMPSAGSCSGGMHEQLAAKLRCLDRAATHEQRIKGRVLAAKLGLLKARRVVADYELAKTLTAAEVAQQRADAEQFLVDCK